MLEEIAEVQQGDGRRWWRQEAGLHIFHIFDLKNNIKYIDYIVG